MTESLLGFVGTRYERAQGEFDELRLRALELIVAACVTEWVHTPKAPRVEAPTPAGSPEPLLWSEDEVPKIDYDDLVPEIDEEGEDLDTSSSEPHAPDAPDEPEPGSERRTQPATRREHTEERVWWEAPPPQPPAVSGSEPVRGSWEPPRSS